ncbi:choice-of-anchor P family protein [Actinomadura hibisca]|uniref:choice-of-anchor P family protein n=1 Tax=Actinomadura hibisca TaxID=68565 RepID=UPI00082F196F|nr:choice-of-anchor P family protein [Actinomadura hibisca]
MSCWKNAGRLVQVSLVAAVAASLAATPAVAAPADNAGAARGNAPDASAFGLNVIGPVRVPPVPAVSSGAGEVRKSVLRENRTKVVKAGVLDVKAQHDRAHSQVADLRVPSAGLRAEAVTAKCLGGRGGAEIADGVVAGKPLAVAPPPNTTVPVDLPELGRASVILNKQERMRDGRLNVTAMEVNLPVGQGKTESIRVASATCGRGRPTGGHPQGPKGPQKPQGPQGPKTPGASEGAKGPQGAQGQHAEAPAPTPVKGDLAVTG